MSYLLSNACYQILFSFELSKTKTILKLTEKPNKYKYTAGKHDANEDSASGLGSGVQYVYDSTTAHNRRTRARLDATKRRQKVASYDDSSWNAAAVIGAVWLQDTAQADSTRKSKTDEMERKTGENKTREEDNSAMSTTERVISATNNAWRWSDTTIAHGV